MAGFTERIYLNSPVWLQQMGVAAYGWWWYRRRFGPRFRQMVSEFREREFWTREQLRNYQEVQLAKVLNAARNSPYYDQVFREAGIGEHLPPFEALRRLPFLSKETLRVRAKDLLTENPPPRGTLVLRSSGTTGTPTEICYTARFHAVEMAVAEARSLNWAGLSYRDRRVMFGVRKVCHFDQSKPPFWRFSPPENMAYASIYHLSPRFLPAYLAFLRAYKPALIMGYPSALFEVAQYASETNDLPAAAKAVITTSETVSERMRDTIEAAWQCRLYDRYGAVEGCVFASQCEYGRYHVTLEIGILEIIDSDGQPCPPNATGEVVCTGLQNTLQPLIRYRIGDVARWSSQQQCHCGRSLPILESIEGRFEDICYTSDGRAMLRFDPVFKGVSSIREAQIVQERLDSFVVYVVPAHGFGSRDIEKIMNNMRLHVGNARVRLEPVSTIARSPSGKFRAVICNLSKEEKESVTVKKGGGSATSFSTR